MLLMCVHYSGVPFVSFAGCVRDVVIGTVIRNLTDNIGSNRVNFDDCPVNVSVDENL